jgi:hypothetical protein
MIAIVFGEEVKIYDINTHTAVLTFVIITSCQLIRIQTTPII